MKFAPDPRLPEKPEMPGVPWHDGTYEESLKAKPKVVKTVVAQDDAIRDESGWASQDDSDWAG